MKYILQDQNEVTEYRKYSLIIEMKIGFKNVIENFIHDNFSLKYSVFVVGTVPGDAVCSCVANVTAAAGQGLIFSRIHFRKM